MNLKHCLLVNLILITIVVFEAQLYTLEDIRVFAHPTVQQGKEQIIILTVPLVNESYFKCNVSSSNYLIDIFETDKSDKKINFLWRRSLDLVTTLNFYGIFPDSLDLIYSSGWYYITRATFWSFGYETIEVEVTTKRKKEQPIIEDVIVQVVYQKTFGECIPKFEILDCPSLERGGKLFEFGRALTLQGGFMESCGGYDVNTPYNWMVYDLLGKIQFENVGYSLRPIWKFKPYHFPVIYAKNLVGMFLVKLSSKLRGLEVHARCYLMPRKAKLVAKLVGRTNRMITEGTTFLIDARRSTDPWCPPGDIQYLKFNWRCTPLVEDYNKFCDSIQKFTGASMRVSTKDLPKSYKIAVYVSSMADPKRRSSAKQYIRIAANFSREINFICMENCEHKEFSSEKAIVIKAQCLNCMEYESLAYKWTLGTREQAISKTETLVYQPTSDDYELNFKVRLSVEDPRKVQTKTKITFLPKNQAGVRMIKNNGPTIGRCVVKPMYGIETKTKFRIVCDNFESKHKPLSYCILSDDIPVGSCSSTPRFKIRFPRTKIASIMVCDARHACVTKNLNIIIANIKGKVNETETQFISLGNYRDVFQHGDSETTFQQCYQLSKTLKKEEDVARLVNAVEAYLPRTLLQFKDLVHFAKNLFVNLQPLNDFKAMLLTKIVRIISESFREVIEGYLLIHTNEKIFVNIVHTLLFIVNVFMIPAEHIPRAQCDFFQADCVGFDDLTDDFETLDTFDPFIVVHIDRYMHLHWELQKCVFYIGKYSFQFLKLSEKGYRKYAFSNYVLEQFYYKLGNKEIRINTNDNQHTLIFSPGLLKELSVDLESKDMMVQVIHEIQNSMYWWYPQVHSPSTKLIWVNIFSAKRTLNFTQLDQPLEVISLLRDLNRQHSDGVKRIKRRSQQRQRQIQKRQVVRSTPRNWQELDLEHGVDVDQDYEVDYDFTINDKGSDFGESLNDFVITGYLDAPYQMQVFRTDLFSDAVLAIKFLTASLDLLVTMTVNEPASSFTVADSACPLYAYRAFNTTFLMMNLCNKTMQAYIVVKSQLRDDDWEGMKGEAIEFSFELESRTCNDWTYDRPEPSWRTVACYPHLNTTLEKGINCQCEYIGQFNTKITPLNAVILPGSGSGGARGEANRWFVMTFYLIVNVILVTYLYYLKSRVKGNDTLLPVVPYDHEKENDGRGHIIVELQIGGRHQAGSTANIHISFLSDNGQYNFVVYRNRSNDCFKKNETITLRLHSRFVKLPTMIALGHDDMGSTPHYFVRNIIVRDLRNNMAQEFRVEQWIRGNQEYFMNSRCYTGGMEARSELYNWRWQFRKAMEFQFNNWFLFQPILGPWRSGMYDDALNRYERSCVWTCKFAITLCIVSCMFGRSTTHACETTKKAYYEPAFIIPLAFLSFIVSCIVHLVLVKLIQLNHKHSIEVWE